MLTVRRNQKSSTVRGLFRNHFVSAANLIYPIFLTEQKGEKTPITSMPDFFRLGLNEAIEEIAYCRNLGIKNFLFFHIVPSEKKSETTEYCLSAENVYFKYISEIKAKFNDCNIIADVALDPYLSHGHDGILNVATGIVDNNETCYALAEYSLLLAQAGVDAVAPSDMMDGRVKVIRERLDDNHHNNCSIFAYSAKFASCLYEPFRDAVGSKQGAATKTVEIITSSKIDKSSYQLPVYEDSNIIRKIKNDSAEGADAIIVKPAMYNGDVISKAKTACELPIIAYQVSSEYSMIKAAEKLHALDYQRFLEESFLCLRRAGASAIITYSAKDYARNTH